MTTFPAAVKFLMPIASVMPAELAAISAVIDNEEGGWVVTSDPNDNDGGWTYGGMTAKTFHEYFPTVTLAMLNSFRNDPALKQTLQQEIVCVYFQEFYIPLITIAVPIPAAYHLSCAINCGSVEAKTLIAQSGGSKSKFLNFWATYYGTLCKNTPSKLMYLNGWLNRVFHYVTDADVTS